MRHGQDSSYILHWNAGRFTQSKKTELIKILKDEKVDIFTLLETNKVKKDMERLTFPAILLLFWRREGK